MYNRITVVGRLTAQPELKQTQSGVSVTSFSVAVGRTYAPKGQERQTDFFNVVAWRNTAEFISKYFSKGNAILLEGTMESREYTDQNGNNRLVWELIASSAHFVESKTKSETAQSEGFTEIDDEDGDLPWIE